MYESTIFDIFDRHVPLKKKYIGANKAPFMSKEFHKVTMKRSRLGNIFLKHKTEINKKIYNTQRNLCKKLLKNTKKSYFEKLGTKKITDNRSFWSTVLPSFTQNSSKGEKIYLIVDIKPYIVMRRSVRHTKTEAFSMASNNLDPIMSVIKSFDKHPSKVKIKAQTFDSTFHFRKTNCNEVEKIISDLNIKNSCQQEDIPTKIIKQKILILALTKESFLLN